MLLKTGHLEELEEYLKSKNWINDEEAVIKVEKPGEGNMNFTLRVYTSAERTFIIKQSRGYVEKYPSISAPADRAIIEGKFYQSTQNNAVVRSFMPQLLGLDEENNMIVVQDLGLSSDFTNVYKQGEQISSEEIKALTNFASELHLNFQREHGDETFTNRAMRALNHEHIFNYPLMENNGFDLDNVLEGLQEVAMIYKTDTTLKNAANKLGEVYLSDGPYLLHGDYYYGSFLRTKDGVKVIDPEFCFYGPAEFDLGVLIAHLKMSEQSQTIIDSVLNNYQKPKEFNTHLLNQFIGIELMRRIIGLAQLPLTLSLKKRTELLKEAKSLITTLT